MEILELRVQLSDVPFHKVQYQNPDPNQPPYFNDELCVHFGTKSNAVLNSTTRRIQKIPSTNTCIREESVQDNLSPIHALLVTLMIIITTNSTARSTRAGLLSFSTDILPSCTKSTARAC